VTGPALPTRPLSRTELIAIDCLLAVLLAAGYLGVALPDAESPGRVWAVCVAVALMSLPIAVRRLWPIPVFVVVLAASVLALASGLLYEPFIAAALASYTAAVAERRLTRRGWTVLGCASVLLVLVSVSAGVVGSWARPLAVLLPGLALVAAMWTAGVAVRERRAYAARSNDERTARAVADERLRIAREVHDIVTHNLGIIAVKAAVARHVSGARPDEAQDALRVIEEISRAALTEMRQVLRVLRTAEPAELQPVGGDLHSLVERAEAAGLNVRYEATGADQLPEGAALSAYRILQEALTNVIKHAGPTRCQVTVRGTGDEVLIDVLDDGPLPGRQPVRSGTDTGGQGLVGMRERVAMYGGELQAGPRTGGGFQVRARLPYRPVGSAA
jgi:signal transduction histidine kinase